MSTTVRKIDVANATGEVLTEAAIAYGQDYGLVVVTRTLAAIDVGTDAGKTRHANGVLCYQASGFEIKSVLSVSVFNANTGAMRAPTLIAPVIRDSKTLAVKDLDPFILVDGDVVTMLIVVGPVA